MLVLDVLDDRVPAVLVVHLVAVPGRVDDVQPQSHAVLRDDMRDRLNLRRLPDRLVRLKPSLRVDQVRREDGVDERRLAQSRLADDHDIKLESALEQLVLDLLRDGVETDIRRRTDLLYFNGGHCYELNEGGEK